MKSKSRKLLSKLYYDPSNASSFSTADSLWKATNETIPLKEVQEWLEHQDSYTLHRPLRKCFIRNTYHVDNIDDLWQADLCDMRTLSKYNDDYNYLLTVIDVFSKYSWAIPLKYKTGAAVTRAFEKIFKEGRKPLKLMTDKGKEFLNKPFQIFLKKNKVFYYNSNNPDTKACFAERFNRTLKSQMWKYFTHKLTKRYVEVLPSLVLSYNNRVHSSIKMAPSNVNDSNILEVWNNLYKKKKKFKMAKPKFSIGNMVRISKEKMIFTKGYEQKWSTEIFKIKKVLNRERFVYVLEDLTDEEIQGTFYEPELTRVRVKDSQMYKINQILRSRGKGVSKQVYVSWVGYPDKFNSWIAASQVKDLTK